MRDDGRCKRTLPTSVKSLLKALYVAGVSYLEMAGVVAVAIGFVPGALLEEISFYVRDP